MFEKEAETIAKDIYVHHFDDDINYPEVLKAIAVGVQNGAEFGYNKANEWNYPSKGELPQCDENTQLIFYVKDWSRIRNDYYHHFALGFYKPPFVIDGGRRLKMFVEESNGYSSEHSPEYVIMWKELVKPEAV